MKKLVAVLAGREFRDNTTLKFFSPRVIKELESKGIDFILASNNKKACELYRKFKSIKLVETSDELHKDFVSRRRESKDNLGAETRETINQYAIANNYNYVVHLDDNIKSLFYRDGAKQKTVKRYKQKTMIKMIELLFYTIENSNAGAVGFAMSAFYAKNPKPISAGFPYSFFCHRVDNDFKFENSTEDDILMTIYNGINKKPSLVIRRLFYGKVGKLADRTGNRKLYNELLKQNNRGSYIGSLYPDIYSCKVSYNVKAATGQKKMTLQHKHRLKLPVEWRDDVYYKENVVERIEKCIEEIKNYEEAE